MTKAINAAVRASLYRWANGSYWSWPQPGGGGASILFNYLAGFPSANQSEFVYTNDANYPLFSGNSLVITDGTVGEHEAAGSWYKNQVNITSFSADFQFVIGAESITGEAFGTGDGANTTFSHTLAHFPRKGTATVTAGGVTATDNGSGALTGAGVSGTIDYRSKVLTVTYTTPPANGTAITCAYHAPAFGMGFIVHNDPSGTGASADANGLGYDTYTYNNPDNAIHNSIALMFNTSAGSIVGHSMVGCYINGGPYVNDGIYPLQDMSRQGIDLFNGNLLQAHVSYDGTVLTLYLTDTVTNQQARFDWVVNIPSIVGSNTAYIGFGGGTIPAGQQLVPGWTFYNGINQRLVSPTFNVAPGTYASAQTVSISGVANSTIYYTTNGVPPTNVSTQYTGPISVNTTTFLQAIATENNYETSFIANALYLIQNTNSPNVNFASGFANSSGLIRTAGTANINSSNLVIVDGAYNNELGSAFFISPVNIQSFNSVFNIHFTSSSSSSHMGAGFVIENPAISTYADVSGFPLSGNLAANATSANLNAAWGGPNGNFSILFSDGEVRTATLTRNSTAVTWSTNLANAVTSTILIGRTVPTCVNGGPYSLGDGNPITTYYGWGGFGNSVAIMFDQWNNNIGLAIGGQTAPLPTPVSGITLGQNPLNCNVSYANSNLTLLIKDTTTNATFSHSWNVNVASVVGANIAYMGFTAATYDSSVGLSIASWTVA